MATQTPSPESSPTSPRSAGRLGRFLKPVQWLFRWCGIALLIVLALNVLLNVLFLFWNPTVIVGLSLRAVRNSPAWQGVPADIDRLIAAHDRPAMLEVDPYVGHHDRPLTSEFVNVTSAFHRRTIQSPPPQPGARRVFVFGGSTTWGYGVPDSDTVPSRLQALLGPAYDVQNTAGIAWQSTQEVHHLLELLARGERPDIVVFYDGFNEKAAAVSNGGDPRRPLLWSALDFSYRSALGKLFAQCPLGRVARVMSMPRWAKLRRVEFAGQAEALSTRILDNWKANREVVRALGARYGFRSYFFWQPDLLSNPPATPYPHFERMKMSPPGAGFADLFKEMAPRFAKALEGRESEGVFQIGSAFAGVEESVYLDYCHVNRRGCEIVAVAIRDALAKAGALAEVVQAAAPSGGGAAVADRESF